MCYIPTTYVPQGWQCPVCKRVYAPAVSLCFYCGAQGETATGTGTGITIAPPPNVFPNPVPVAPYVGDPPPAAPWTGVGPSVTWGSGGTTSRPMDGVVSFGDVALPTGGGGCGSRTGIAGLPDFDSPHSRRQG